MHDFRLFPFGVNGRRWPRGRQFGALIASLTLGAGAAHAQSSPQDFLAAWQARAEAIGAADASAAPGRCDDLSRSLIDVPGLAQTAARQAALTLTPARLPTLVAAVERYIQKNCVTGRAQSRGVALRLLGVRSTDGATLVTADATGKNGARRVSWRLRAGPGGLRALDVTVDGVSLASQVGSVLQRRLAQSGDVDLAIAALAHG